ncbi:hypothetical protein BDZ45DRAFT_268723 [Acephala macrosclerotiorum]|nr:hypothetical protein BDZ45DRAFT_268723 [Acephala macrosclerotiorum]
MTPGGQIPLSSTHFFFIQKMVIETEWDGYAPYARYYVQSGKLIQSSLFDHEFSEPKKWPEKMILPTDWGDRRKAAAQIIVWWSVNTHYAVLVLLGGMWDDAGSKFSYWVDATSIPNRNGHGMEFWVDDMVSKALDRVILMRSSKRAYRLASRTNW